jgi:hypothetical protein
MTKLSTLKEKTLSQSVDLDYSSLKLLLDKVQFEPSSKAIRSVLDYSRK